MFSVGVICQTGQPYSMIVLTRLLYILSSFVLEMFAKPFISLIIWMELLGFSLYMHDVRYDNVTLIPLGSKSGLRVMLSYLA